MTITTTSSALRVLILVGVIFGIVVGIVSGLLLDVFAQGPTIIPTPPPSMERMNFEIQSLNSQLSSANDYVSRLQRENAWKQKEIDDLTAENKKLKEEAENAKVR